MNTLHSWFRSGSYALPRHIDIPQTRRDRLGVVIIPPFGWEDICSYRPLRFLARTIAASGFPVMRFDLPGTGDSSGSALDSGLVQSWIQSIGDAAAELRSSAGVEDVAVVGIGLGAMLGATAAARGADLQELVLWGAATIGRALLRELRIFGKMESPEFADGAVPPPQPIPGLEIAGFLISPETQKDLESLDLLALPRMQGGRILILSRGDFPPDKKFVAALEATGRLVEVGTGGGYAAMMTPPHEAIPPVATGELIVEFLKRRRGEGEKPEANRANTVLTESAGRQTVAIDEAGSRVLETMHAFGRSGSIFGVVSTPAAGAPERGLCLLFLNPGSVRHVGANRMWVQAARRWAARGLPSLRMDFTGIGESGGEPVRDVGALYKDELFDDIEAAFDFLRAHLGAKEFAVVGICSGAFWAFQSAVRYPDVRGAIAVNPRLFFWDPEVDRRRLLRRTVSGLADSQAWSRLARGRINLQRVRQAAVILIASFRDIRGDSDRGPQIPAQKLSRSLRSIESNQTRLAFVFTEGEPLLREMEEEGQLPPANMSGIRCIRIANCGHTFRPLWAQQWLHELIDREFEAVLRETAPGLKRRFAKISR